MKKFISEIKQVQKNLKVFSLRTSIPEYKKKIQKLISLTEHIISGTGKLPLRIEIIERGISDMPKCNNIECNNPIYTFDISKKRFCPSKCQSIYNNKNMSKESIMKAAKNRNYNNIQIKRKKTMENDIIDGKNAHQRSSIKASLSHDYNLSRAKAVKTMIERGQYEKISRINSIRMKQIEDNGNSVASNIWFSYWDNLDDRKLIERNKKIIIIGFLKKNLLIGIFIERKLEI